VEFTRRPAPGTVTLKRGTVAPALTVAVDSGTLPSLLVRAAGLRVDNRGMGWERFLLEVPLTTRVVVLRFGQEAQTRITTERLDDREPLVAP
jgi:hypothetical protein